MYYFYGADDGGHPLAEYNGSSWQTNVMAGGTIIATVSEANPINLKSPSAVNYMALDQLGNMRMTQSSVFQTYYPYGEAGNSAVSSEYTWTNQIRGTNSGMDHFWFRSYAAPLARWITPDPVGLAAVDPANPQSWNRYAYTSNDPLGLRDYLGLSTNGSCGSGSVTNQYGTTNISNICDSSTPDLGDNPYTYYVNTPAGVTNVDGYLGYTSSNMNEGEESYIQNMVSDTISGQQLTPALYESLQGLGYDIIWTEINWSIINKNTYFDWGYGPVQLWVQNNDESISFQNFDSTMAMLNMAGNMSDSWVRPMAYGLGVVGAAFGGASAIADAVPDLWELSNEALYNPDIMSNLSDFIQGVSPLAVPPGLDWGGAAALGYKLGEACYDGDWPCY